MSDNKNNNTYEESFYIVPRYIRKLPGLTLAYLDVYETIHQFWNKNKNCFLSEAALCERTGYKRAIIYRALAFFELHHQLKRRVINGKRYLIRPEQIILTDLEDGPTSTDVDPDVYNRRQSTSTTVDHNIKNINKETNLTTIGDFKESPKEEAKTIDSNYEYKDTLYESPPESYKEDERFMRFYSIYPNKQKPQVAWKAFLKLRPNDELLDFICKDVITRINNNWANRAKHMIPYPSVYLNQGEWQGEIVPATKNTKYSSGLERLTLADVLGA